MTYDADERSASGSRPIELFVITAPSGTYYVTTHAVNVVFGSLTYTAIPMSRGAQQIAQDLVGRELVVSLPISHPVIQRYAATGIPEREVSVQMYRFQETSGSFVLQWSAFANGLSVDGRLGTLRLPSLTDDAMRVKLPVWRAQRICQHRLYDGNCNPGDGPSETSFQVDTNVAAIVGSTLIVASMGGQPNAWATFGAVRHNATGERRRILDQTSTTLQLGAPFVSIFVGSSLSVFAGCNRGITTCRDKFVNVANYGGHAYMTTRINTFLPKGVGVIEQT